MRLSIAIAAILVSLQLSAAQGISVYFTNPPQKRAGADHPMSRFIQFTRSAERTLDIAIYDLDLIPLADAILAAAKRGVAVRMVVDSDTLESAALHRLIDAGIGIVPDRRKPFMHNKFAIADGVRVWTGSWNFTKNCSFRNENNALWIESEGMAAVYAEEFAEMYEGNVFGNRKDEGLFGITGKEKYYARVGEADVNMYFAPDNDVEEIIVERIRKAERSVDFLAFAFTSDPIAQALAAAVRRGVTVRGVYDKSGAKGTGSRYVQLVSSGADVRVKRGAGVMHHKVIIIDGGIVITGSYNFTRSASLRNDENLLIISDPETAARYAAEFAKIFSQSRTPASRGR